jgi:hypothetical protein
MEFVNFFGKNQRLHIQMGAIILKMTSYRTMSKNKIEKKWKFKILWAKKTFFLACALQSLGSFSHVTTQGSTSNIQDKMNLQPDLNKNFSRIHMELEFDVLDVAKILMENEVHLSKDNNN